MLELAFYDDLTHPQIAAVTGRAAGHGQEPHPPRHGELETQMGGGRCRTWTTTGWCFLALGESEADDRETGHLDGCAHCRAEIGDPAARWPGSAPETQGLRDLPDPPEHVWQGIAAEVGTAETCRR